MTIKIDSIGGNCPVQAEGTIDGFPFYFRARGSHWQLSIANGENFDPVAVSCGFAEGWRYSEDYGEGPFDAGYMTEEEALTFIDKAVALFRKGDSDDQ